MAMDVTLPVDIASKGCLLPTIGACWAVVWLRRAQANGTRMGNMRQRENAERMAGMRLTIDGLLLAGVQMVDFMEELILAGFRPSLQDGALCGTRTSDCAALIRGYSRFSLREKETASEASSLRLPSLQVSSLHVPLLDVSSLLGRLRGWRTLTNCSGSMVLLAALLLLFGVPLWSQSNTVAPAKAATPILIELFTSEGCSSCPPADAWLKQMDVTQPIPGAQAIVLSEHVDYWNHDGWTDPYSSAFFTDRQSAYVRALQGSSPYTPEMVVNGETEVQLSDQAQITKVLVGAAKAQQLPVAIDGLKIEGASLHAHIDIDGATSRHNADVYAVVALNHAESKVLRGENGGRQLMHAAVALELVKVGKLEKGKPFSRDFQAKIKPGVDPNNLRLVVFVQESGPGPVLGAAVKEVGGKEMASAVK
jgi:hypothetical protein